MKKPQMLKVVHRKNNPKIFGLFQCPLCPNLFITRKSYVTTGHTKSCGCRSRLKPRKSQVAQ